VVIFKSIETPSMQDFEMITKARTLARKAGLKESNIQKAIKKARG
jgi:hypothetical protein